MNEEKDLRSNHITSDPDSKFTFFKSNFLYSPYFHYILPVLYFLIILFVSLTNRAIGDYGVESDFYSGYAPQAKELLSGNLVIDPFKGPLYSIILSIVGFICGEDFYFAGKIINIFSSAIALIFVSKLISTLLNRESAFFGTLIIAVNYTFLTFAYTPDTDMLFFLFYISALYFILKPDFVEFNKFVFIAGVLTSFAYLTRYTAISLIIFVSMFFLVRVYKWFRIRKNIPPPPIFKPIIYYFIPVIIIIIAWGTISYKKTGHFFYNQNYENTSYTLYKPEGMSKEEWNDKYKDNFKSMSDVIFEDAGKFIRVIFIKNLPTYVKKDITRLLPKYFGIFVILGIGFFIIKLKKTSSSQKYFFLASILFYLQILLIFYTERFSIPLLPFYSFMILWFFSVDLFDRFNFRISSFRLFGIFLSMLIAYNLYTSYNQVKEEINVGPMEILSIKEQVESNKYNNLSGKVIMSRKPHIAYYLGMKSQVTPFVKNYDEYINYIRANNIEYVYISEKEAEYLTDENLKHILLDYTNPPADFEVVTFTLKPIAILYKLK